MIFNYITWNVNPEIFSIGNFEVRWYGVLFALAFYLGYIIMSRFFKKEGIPIELLDKLTIYMVIGTVIGARLGHCLFYEPDYYLSHPLQILNIRQGGLASHGAAIAILLALLLFVKKHKKSYLWVLDRIVIVTALAGFFIRMGNLVNSEIYGNETNLPWGFIFELNGEVVPKHPTQIYEGLSYLLIFFFLLFLYNKNQGKTKNGMLFSLFLIILFIVRFLIEFIKEDQVGFEDGMALNMGQLLSIPFVLTGFLLFYLSSRKKAG